MCIRDSGYAIYDASGELLETDMSGSIRENADLLALSGQDSLSANMLGRTYVKRQTDTRIVVLTYDFRSAFANPTLRRLFPSAELLEVFLLLFLLLEMCIRDRPYRMPRIPAWQSVLRRIR